MFEILLTLIKINQGIPRINPLRDFHVGMGARLMYRIVPFFFFKMLCLLLTPRDLFRLTKQLSRVSVSKRAGMSHIRICDESGEGVDFSKRPGKAVATRAIFYSR